MCKHGFSCKHKKTCKFLHPTSQSEVRKQEVGLTQDDYTATKQAKTQGNLKQAESQGLYKDKEYCDFTADKCGGVLQGTCSKKHRVKDQTIIRVETINSKLRASTMTLVTLGMKSLVEHVQSQFSPVSINLIHMEDKILGEPCLQKFEFTGDKNEVDQAVQMLMGQI